MAALLIVGGVALILAAVFVFKDWTAKQATKGRGWVLAGFFAAVVLWVAGLIALASSVDWLADNGHYIAAGGLLVSILVVIGANAHRREEKPSAGDLLKGVVLKSSLRTYRYTWIAIAMLVISGVLIVLWMTNAISLFWVEILVAFLFVIFWTVQTIDVEHEARA